MKVIWTTRFQKDIEYYIKKKKYFKIKDDIQSVVDELEKGNLVGDELQNINVNGKTFKVRTAISKCRKIQWLPYYLLCCFRR